LTAAGTGKKARAGTGAATLPLLTGAGEGETEEGTPGEFSGSGAASLPLLTASGAGKRALRGTGAASLPLLTAAGTGKRAIKGSGTPSLPLLAAAGTAKRSLKSSGTSTLPLLTAAGEGEVEGQSSGAGALTLPLLTATGTGKRALLGSGAASLPLLTLVATGEGAGGVAAEPEPSTGGWAEHFRREQAALKRADEESARLEAEELRALAERLEAHLVETGVLLEADARADLVRLRGLASQYVPSDLPRRAQRALDYAERAQSEFAVQLALRELDRLQEEEAFALLMVLAVA